MILIIFVPMWFNGEALDSQKAFSLLAMIFYLFNAVTTFYLFALSTMNQLWVLFDRLGDIFGMEEYVKKR